jgi:hypothetical protein
LTSVQEFAAGISLSNDLGEGVEHEELWSRDHQLRKDFCAVASLRE